MLPITTFHSIIFFISFLFNAFSYLRPHFIAFCLFKFCVCIILYVTHSTYRKSLAGKSKFSSLTMFSVERLLKQFYDSNTDIRCRAKHTLDMAKYAPDLVCELLLLPILVLIRLVGIS